jgi:2-iminobutanoate/2-iminopropanoate deaminase
VSGQRIASRLGHFSEVVAVDGPGRSIHVAGQVGVDADGALVAGGTGAEAEAIFSALAGHLAAVGATLADVTALRIYLVDLTDYAAFAAARARAFPVDPPAATAVGVAGLLLGASIEIEATAFVER